MADDSPFGDFTDAAQPVSFDEDQPIALGPPTDYTNQQPQQDDDANDLIHDDGELEGDNQQQQTEDDAFGLSSPAGTASSQTMEESDPFATVDGGSSSNAGAFDSFSNQPAEPAEDEAAALKAWEAERAVVLRDRAAKAAADKDAALKAAREETQKFYSDRDSQVSKAQKTNRADEKNYRSDMKSTFESGQRWEKVNKLISTQPRANEKPGTSRVERMRKLLIQLKSEKPKA